MISVNITGSKTFTQAVKIEKNTTRETPVFPEVSK
jgi:hypothetical protein